MMLFIAFPAASVRAPGSNVTKRLGRADPSIVMFPFAKECLPRKTLDATANRTYEGKNCS
jgi:hypothetical protein